MTGEGKMVVTAVGKNSSIGKIENFL